jgi:capsular exopolysaccharide synthesis family protein
MAVVGFVWAWSLPIMAVMALGFFSHRIQYSDDGILTSTGAGIVGMLPDLGNGLTDHEIATASAFAVHQIRSQLQILNSQSETMVYGVTSPAPQDGKTSLIIAMGLSFAESGDRTLLVDLDFIGRGLSVHFGYPDAPSLAEVLESHDEVEEQICDTEFDNLSILPAGFGDDERVSRLSPRSVGSFVEFLRGEYDTILIDTGPILGSVEAAFVAPQADGVILVVGRGQLKPLVQKAIDQIVGVQGKILATIFNRARIQELRQSSNSMSVHFSRQMSRQQDEMGKRNGAWGGPVAGALVRSKNKADGQSPVVKSMKP